MSERVVFHASLYDRAAVESAASAYAELASIAVTMDGDEITATIAHVTTDQSDLVDWFCNHALHATVDGRRAQQSGSGSS